MTMTTPVLRSRLRVTTVMLAVLTSCAALGLPSRADARGAEAVQVRLLTSHLAELARTGDLNLQLSAPAGRRVTLMATARSYRPRGARRQLTEALAVRFRGAGRRVRNVELPLTPDGLAFVRRAAGSCHRVSLSVLMRTSARRGRRLAQQKLKDNANCVSWAEQAPAPPRAPNSFSGTCIITVLQKYDQTAGSPEAPSKHYYLYNITGDGTCNGTLNGEAFDEIPIYLDMTARGGSTGPLPTMYLGDGTFTFTHPTTGQTHVVGVVLEDVAATGHLYGQFDGDAVSLIEPFTQPPSPDKDHISYETAYIRTLTPLRG